MPNKPSPSVDVFISFKNTGSDGEPTTDAAWAKKVRLALGKERIRAFLSSMDMSRSGKSVFEPVIEQHLQHSKVMVLVASCKEHIESGWVQEEWRAFHAMLRNGKEGALYIFNCGNLAPRKLPLFMQKYQMFGQGELKSLVQSIRKSLPQGYALGDFVHCALHCHRPSQRQDKVYIVTIREDEIGFQVKVHWGPRNAPRLKSQLKGVGITDRAEAVRIADSLRRGKESVGYRRRPVKSLLSSAARRLLESDLAISLAHPRTSRTGDEPKTKNSGDKIQVPVEKHSLEHLTRDQLISLVCGLHGALAAADPAKAHSLIGQFMAPAKTTRRRSRTR